MALTFRTLFLMLLAILSLLLFEDWVSTPSCNNTDNIVNNNLKVMMVADLLLSDSGFVNRVFRDYYMSKFFRVLTLLRTQGTHFCNPVFSISIFFNLSTRHRLLRNRSRFCGPICLWCWATYRREARG